MVDAFNPTLRSRGRGIYEFEASLIYIESSRTAGLDSETLPQQQNKQTNKKRKQERNSIAAAHAFNPLIQEAEAGRTQVS